MLVEIGDSYGSNAFVGQMPCSILANQDMEFQLCWYFAKLTVDTQAWDGSFMGKVDDSADAVDSVLSHGLVSLFSCRVLYVLSIHT